MARVSQASEAQTCVEDSVCHNQLTIVGELSFLFTYSQQATADYVDSRQKFSQDISRHKKIEQASARSNNLLSV